MTKLQNAQQRNEEREQALHEAKRTLKYINSSMKYLEGGNFNAAVRCFDIAKDAKECADYCMEQLWELSNDKPTEEEFEAICEVEALAIAIKNMGRILMEN